MDLINLNIARFIYQFSSMQKFMFKLQRKFNKMTNDQ